MAPSTTVNAITTCVATSEACAAQAEVWRLVWDARLALSIASFQRVINFPSARDALMVASIEVVSAAWSWILTLR